MDNSPMLVAPASCRRTAICGMDIVLVRLDKAQPGKLAYAGANWPLWIILREKEVVELCPIRQPVGYTEMDRPFEEVEVDLSLCLPVMLYGFMDGRPDGRPEGSEATV